jgi:tetratricopeptide (TPR) repeat protein
MLGIPKLSSSLSDRTGNRYQREGRGYPNDGRGYASKHVYGAKRYFRPQPLGKCYSLSTNNTMLTIAQTQVRSAKLNTMGSLVLRFHSVTLGELPPPAPRDCFGREELIEKLVGLTEKLEPIALIGAGGIGKTSIALTVLHHNRVEERFGENRRFIRCDQFPASRANFLARLSEVLGAGIENPKDLSHLRPLLSSKEVLIILDNAESILDPKGTSAKEIYSVVDELCQFKRVCLCITSRITTVPPRCKRLEIPTLSMEAACDIFYGIYGDGGRSNIVSDLLKRLDFHALSTKLLATTASQNSWDYDRLVTEWDAQRVKVLQTDYNESLAATIELSLTSPTFHSLGPNARDLLGVVAFFPQGIHDKNPDWLFPTISNVKNVFDKFCALSLMYRNNGFITMLAPIRDHLHPQDPLSSPLLCTTRDSYFNRLSTDLYPGKPMFEEARWIVLEDVNVEYLLDVSTSTDQTRDNNWDACFHFMQHLYWHKPRHTILESTIEALEDNHRSKPKCLFQLSLLIGKAGNRTKEKRLLTRTLELERQRGDDARVAETLRNLSMVNRLLKINKEGIGRANEALEIFQRINDTTGQAKTLNSLAWVLCSDGQLGAAEKAASHAIDLISEKGQEFLACSLHRALGTIHQSKGEKEKAIHHYKTALAIAIPFNWHHVLFWAHWELARLFRDGREFDNANTHIEQAKPHAIHNSYDLARAMEIQAGIWYGQGKLEAAKFEASQALEVFEKVGDEISSGYCRNLLWEVERAIKAH